MDGQPAQQDDVVSLTRDEVAGVEAAIADADARGTIAWEDVEAWLDSLDSDNPLPEPQPSKL